MSFLKMTKMEIKLFLLEPLSVFFTLAFALLLLFVFGLIFGNDPFPGTTLGFLDIATPSYMAMIIGPTALMGIPVGLASYRDQGILRRFRATPANVRILLGAQLFMHFLMTALGIILLIVAGRLFYYVKMPADYLGGAVAFVGSTVSFFALGSVLTVIAPTARTAQAVGMAPYFPMLSLSGAALPRQIMPASVQRAAEFIPLTHVNLLLSDLWHGEGWRVASLLVLGALLVAGVAITTFAIRRERE